MDRRHFLAGAAALPMMASLPNLSMAEAHGKPWNGKSLIFDAMGELRDVYDNSLVEEMLEAGMRSICITLCDPKVQEQEAYDLTIVRS